MLASAPPCAPALDAAALRRFLTRLRRFGREIEPALVRHPAIAPAAFRRELDAFLAELAGD